MHVGIIGYKGRVAQRHIRAWNDLGIKWEGCDKEDNWLDFIQKGWDIIDICTPIYLHPKMITVSMQYSDVICEKPVATNLDIATKVVDFAEHYRKKVGIIYQFRYNPKVLRLKREIADGKYGEIKLVTSHYYRYRDLEYYGEWEGDVFKAGGGVVFNVTIHYLDLMQWIFGYPTEIRGLKTLAKQGMDIEDTACAIMRFPNGAIGNYVATTHADPPKHYEMSVYGTKGHTTIQLRQNEYHKQNFEAFINNKDYVTPMEAVKSLRMALEIIK
jgi:predicted dehydrogenase